MKRAVVGSAVLALGSLMLSAAAPGTAAGDRTASGTGTIRFGAEGLSVAMFDFSLTADPQPLGEFLCAAETNHNLYPEIIVRVERITSLTIRKRTINLVAEGTLHDDPVTVHVYAWDGEGTKKKYWFSIKTVPQTHNDDGHGHFVAEGEVKTGDIRIYRPQ